MGVRRGRPTSRCLARSAGLSDSHSGLGRVAEWFKAPVLKTGVPARVPWVRIPPLPPVKAKKPIFFNIWRFSFAKRDSLGLGSTAVVTYSISSKLVLRQSECRCCMIIGEPFGGRNSFPIVATSHFDRLRPERGGWCFHFRGQAAEEGAWPIGDVAAASEGGLLMAPERIRFAQPEFFAFWTRS